MTIPFLIKYKPNSFSDVMLDKAVKQLLINLIKTDNISVILIGEHGSGKTTFINCVINEYYKDVPNVIKNDNILFVNSIKEQGIQHYKNEVSVFCQTKSTILNKKKTIIIDDLDNINEQNQQIFRNSLDKYQANINFIFACISPKKILNSILSRVLCVNIKKPDLNDQISLAKKIVKNEKLVIHDNMILKLVELNNGSLQNIVNVLEKIYLLGKPCTLELLDNVSTIIETETLDKFTNLVINEHKLEEAIFILVNIYNKGYSIVDILDTYFNYIKISETLSEKIKYNITKMICKYITIINLVHDSELELCFFVNELVKIGYIYAD